MQEVVKWLKSAITGTLLIVLRICVIGFALLGLSNAAMFVATLNSHKCAEITPYISVCLVPNQEVK